MLIRSSGSRNGAPPIWSPRSLPSSAARSIAGSARQASSAGCGSAIRRARWVYGPIWMRCRSRRPIPRLPFAARRAHARLWPRRPHDNAARRGSLLAETRAFDGTVHFIFQPAEEGLGGAEAMVKEGMFDRFPCDAIFGMHNRPGLAVGKFALRTGPMMAGGGFFDITVIGRGAHGARPESGIDPVVAASHIAAALQTIVSRNVRPVDTAVVSVTRFHAGDAYNVIPERAVVGGTVRAFESSTLTLIEQNMRRIASGVAAGFGATAELDFRNL